MIKNLQSLAASKAIIIDKSILKLMNNPKSFNLEYDGKKITLTPIAKDSNEEVK